MAGAGESEILQRIKIAPQVIYRAGPPTAQLRRIAAVRLRRNHGQTDKRGPARTGESGLRAARTAFPGALGGTRKFLGTPSRNHEVPQDAPMSCGSCRSCRSCPGTRQDERSCVPPVKSTQSRPSTPGPAPCAWPPCLGCAPAPGARGQVGNKRTGGVRSLRAPCRKQENRSGGEPPRAVPKT